MSADTVAALAVPAIKDKFDHAGYGAQGSSPDELRDWLKLDTDKWAAVIKAADIKID
jgi:tripartite-type tricarboxylate transporter receptor subunit TctC